MCTERCGSNLITKILNSHSQICGPSPKHIINPVVRNYFRYRNLNEDKNWNNLLKDVLNLYNVKFSIWAKEFTIEELQSKIKKGDIKELIRFFFEQETKANGKKDVFIKELKIYEVMPYLLLYFPEAKYIYQVRDPRDMALSWKKNKTHKGGVVAAAQQWKEDQQQYLKNHEILRPLGKSYMIKYEDLIADLEKHLGGLLAFLGHDYEPQLVNFHEDNLTLKNSKAQEAWNNLSKGVITENSGKFNNELTNLEIKIVEKICYAEMVFLGYEPINTLESLEEIKNSDIEKLAQEELETLPYILSDGVKNNRDAKKIFYQKIIA